MKMFIQYLNEYQYEIYKMRDLMQDIQFQKITQSKAFFNSKYEFSFQLMRNDNHILNQFFLIYFNICDLSETHLFFSKFSISVTLTLSVALNISDIKFIKQIISLFFISNKYNIFMIFIMK